MQNSEIAKVFFEIAELLEVSNENIFKLRAFQKAAQAVSSYKDSLADKYKKGGIKALEEIDGIGLSTAEIIEDLIKTGKSKRHEELLHKFPKGFIKLLEIPGIGPKTALLLHKEFKIETIDDLEKALNKGLLKSVPGFKEKKQENIAKGLELKKKVQGRFLISEATEYADAIVKGIKASRDQGIKDILIAGSLRRGQETIGDIDILVVSEKPKKVMDTFVKLPIAERTLSHGETKSSIIMKNGMQADIRVVPRESFGAAAHYLTGSKSHNIHIRQLAQKKGWKVNEYGIFSAKGGSASGGDGKQIGGTKEEEMFSMFGLEFIPPELREMHGEFEAAKNKNIPQLVELKDIKGDLQMHSTYSDGANSIEEMVRYAKDLGYSYIAITDHSKSTRIAGGLSEQEVLKQLSYIDKLNSKLEGFRILKGIEVDILKDGSLDYRDDILKHCEVVMAAVHSNFKMDKILMTKRIIRALENKYVNILSHPTGRLIGRRDPYELDMEEIFLAAKGTGTFLEINAQPDRLDLNDTNARRAKELGIFISIDTDAHSASQLNNMKYGVLTARRGWLTKKEVINTLPIEKLLKKLYSKRSDKVIRI